jgi:hypothetical protein
MPPRRPRGLRHSRTWACGSTAEGPSVPLFDQNVTGITDVPSVCGYNQLERMANRLGWELEMSERRITQLFGLGLGAIITCTMVLNAFAF